MWVVITLAAATFQVVRTGAQHRLRVHLGVWGAGFTRFLYGLPLAVVALAVTFVGRPMPEPTAEFWWWVTAAGVAQILGTSALLWSFRLRDFAIGTVYAKSEIVVVAVLAAVLLDEGLSPLGWLGVIVAVVGVVALAGRTGPRDVLRGAADPAALAGLAAAVGFALAAAGIRAASLSLSSGTVWERAIMVLAPMLGIQTVLNGALLAVIDRPELKRVVTAWRPAVAVGVLSFAGSASWATAMTLHGAAQVRTLGQVELLIAFAVSVVWLGERPQRWEYGASALVLAGVVAVVVGG